MELLKLRRGFGKAKVIEAIQNLSDEESWDIKISKKRFKRSISQNNLYWLWLTCIEQETGNDRDSLHDYFKQKFLGIEEILVLGETISRIRSTTNRDTAQFKIYLDKIQMFASVELGIVLPDPENKYWSDFYETYKYLL